MSQSKIAKQKRGGSAMSQSKIAKMILAISMDLSKNPEVGKILEDNVGKKLNLEQLDEFIIAITKALLGKNNVSKSEKMEVFETLQDNAVFDAQGIKLPPTNYSLQASINEEGDLVFASEEEALQCLSDLTGDKIIIASDRKPVTEHELRDLGVEHEQYFQGAGTFFTKWEDVFVGIGNSPYEAAEDALDNAAHTYDVDSIKNNMSKKDTVSEEDGDEIYQYVALYVK